MTLKRSGETSPEDGWEALHGHELDEDQVRQAGAGLDLQGVVSRTVLPHRTVEQEIRK